MSDKEELEEKEEKEEREEWRDFTDSEEESDSDDDRKGKDKEDSLVPQGKSFEFAHEKKVKKVSQSRQKKERREAILEKIDHNLPPKLCGGVDVYLVKASKFLPEKHQHSNAEGGEAQQKKVSVSGKSFYVKMEISWPRHIYSAVQKSPSEKVDPDAPDEVEWGNYKFKNVAVYQRGGDDVKNSWMKYPKLIFTLKGKGKLFNQSISQAEVLLGPTVIEPKPGEDKNNEDHTVPLLTLDGEVRGDITVRIKYQSCARKGPAKPQHQPIRD